MSEIRTKRKSRDESEEEATRPRKRLRIEDIILEDISKEQSQPVPDSSSVKQHSAVKRRHKLLTSLQLQKRYKYTCKKHNVSYLVESKREESKKSTQQKRDSLVQNFRFLHVNLQPEGAAQDGDSSPVERQDDAERSKSDDKNMEVDDKGAFVKPESPKRAIKRKLIPDQEAEDNDFNEDSKEPDSKKSKGKQKPYDVFRDELEQRREQYYEDSDYETDYQKSRRRKPKVVKCVIIRKVIDQSNIIYSEGEDFTISDSDDDSDCDCPYHDDLKKKCRNYEHESSSSDDDDSGSLPKYSKIRI